MSGNQILEQSEGWTRKALRSEVIVYDVLYHMWSSDLSTQLGSQVLELKCSYLTLIRYKDENHVTIST